MRKSILFFAIAAGLSGVFTAFGTPYAAESLFEYYSRASRETLAEETREMSHALKGTFGEHSIAARQQQIDFAEYFSNLKKLARYGSRLAGYCDYKADLDFARDNELFKGLPDEARGQKEAAAQRRGFVADKYDRMTVNVEEEIETYNDLLKTALDACEAVSRDDLSGIFDCERCQRQVARYTNGTDYRGFSEKRMRLQKGWPDLADRIFNQFARWHSDSMGPDTPILDPAIIEVL